jgi:uncharacterized phiE125 gp8 family phage protein
MLTISVTTQGTTEPVSVALALAHVRGDSADENQLLELYITAARGRCEVFTGRTIVPRTYRLKAPRFADVSQLPVGPINSISSVTYYDADDTEQTLASTVYQLSGDYFSLAHDQEWPVTNGREITINYTAGYAVGQCPGGLRAAILLYVGDMFSVRESQIVGVSAIKNETAEALLWPFVVNPLGLVLVTE